MPTNNATSVSKASLVKLTAAEAKKVGENYASFVVGLHSEFARNKVDEIRALDLMKGAAAFGDCSSGGMCAILT